MGKPTSAFSLRRLAAPERLAHEKPGHVNRQGIAAGQQRLSFIAAQAKRP
ncbi:hypothetical protein THH46_25070 [Pseudomonas sp. NA13]